MTDKTLCWGIVGCKATEHVEACPTGLNSPLVAQPVTEVLEGEFWPALKPLLDLLGVTPFHIMGDAGITITGATDDPNVWHIRFQRVVEDMEAELPWPKSKTGDGEADIWVYDVDVRVRPMSGGDASAFWHEYVYPEGTPVEPEAGA